jgi:hypothetical protein
MADQEPRRGPGLVAIDYGPVDAISVEVEEHSWKEDIGILAITLAVTALLVAFSDRDGYEGDDLSVISAVTQMDEARKGEIFLYRYSWQPLAYEASAVVYRLFNHPDALFLISPICCGVSVGISLLTMRRLARHLRSPVVHLALMMLFPEIFYAGLFYNTTAPAMPVASVAYLALFGFAGRTGALRPALIGLCMALASFIRFDFFLAVPFVMAVLWAERQSIRPLLQMAAGAGLVVAIATLVGLFRPLELLETLHVHHAEVNLGQAAYSWTWKKNIKVIAVIMHPFAWTLVLAGLPALARRTEVRFGRTPRLVLAASLLPLFYPMTSFTSAKYAIPLILLLPLAMQQILDGLCDQRLASKKRLVSLGVVVSALFAWMVSVEPAKRPPFVNLTVTEPLMINTHDGQRTFGAYAMAMCLPCQSEAAMPDWAAARLLHEESHASDARDIWFVGEDSTYSRGRIGWRYLRLLLAREGLHGTHIAPHTLAYSTGNCRVILTVPSLGESELARRLAPTAIRIDASMAEETPEQVLRRVEEQMAASRGAQVVKAMKM